MNPETEAVDATVWPDTLEEWVTNNSTAKATISARRLANGEDGSRNIVMPPESLLDFIRALLRREAFHS
jgi:hypothetical protein